MEKAYQKTSDELYKELSTSEQGLSNEEAKRRIKTEGLNILIDKNKRTKLQIFLSQFKNMMIILLLVVGILSLFYAIMTGEDFLEPLVILGTTLVNCIMGYLQESKAEDQLPLVQLPTKIHCRVHQPCPVFQMRIPDETESFSDRFPAALR